MTNEELQTIVDSLKADAMKFKNKGEVGYANGLFDAARRVERVLPEPAIAPPLPKPPKSIDLLEPEPNPAPEAPKGVFKRILGD